MTGKFQIFFEDQNGERYDVTTVILDGLKSDFQEHAKVEETLIAVCAEELDRAIVEGHQRYTVEWFQENREAIFQNLKVDKLDNLLEFCASEFTRQFVSLPDRKIDICSRLVAENKNLRSAVAEATAATAAITEAQEAVERAELLEAFRVGKSMTLMDKGRLQALSEGMSLDTLRSNIDRLYEMHFSRRPITRADVLSETFEAPPKEPRYHSELIRDAVRILG